MTRVLGLDLSLTRTGVGIIDYADPQCTARVEIVASQGKRADSLASRDQRIVQIASDVLVYAPDSTVLAVVEGPAMRAMQGSIWDRSAVWWCVVHGLLRAGIRVVSVPPATLKKWATGRGNADKSDVSVAMARLWPSLESPSNDGWDSIGLATMGAQSLSWPVPERAHHAESRARIDWGDGKKAAS